MAPSVDTVTVTTALLRTPDFGIGVNIGKHADLPLEKVIIEQAEEPLPTLQILGKDENTLVGETVPLLSRGRRVKEGTLRHWSAQGSGEVGGGVPVVEVLVVKATTATAARARIVNRIRPAVRRCPADMSDFVAVLDPSVLDDLHEVVLGDGRECVFPKEEGPVGAPRETKVEVCVCTVAHVQLQRPIRIRL